MRFPISTIGIPPDDFLRKIEGPLLSLDMNFFFDYELLFSESDFRPGNQGWAPQANGILKGGAVRYKSGEIRIPGMPAMKVYETKERGKRAPPRALVTVPSIVVCHADQLNRAELALAGYSSLDDMLGVMGKYYRDLHKDSIVSFYYLGETTWYRPDTRITQRFPAIPDSN